VHATQVLLIIEMKLDENLEAPGVLGQVAQYALEIARVQAMVRPCIVAVMNKTHVLFVEVSDGVPTKVHVSPPFHLLGEPSEQCGLYRLTEYVLECAAVAERQAATEWGKKYITLRLLGAGATARALVARRRGDAALGGQRDDVVIKVFTATVYDVASPVVVDRGRHPFPRLGVRHGDGAARVSESVSSPDGRSAGAGGAGGGRRSPSPRRSPGRTGTLTGSGAAPRGVSSGASASGLTHLRRSGMGFLSRRSVLPR
jgi:hypothetical protein